MFSNQKQNLTLVLIFLPISFHFLNDIAQLFLSSGTSKTTSVKDLFWFIDFISYFFIPVVILSVYIRKGLYKKSDLGIKFNNLMASIFIGIVLAVVLWNIFLVKHLYINQYLAQLYSSSAAISSFFYSQQDGTIRLFVGSLYIAFSAGIIEEIFYRSYLIKSLEKRGISTFNAGFVAVLAFVLIHLASGPIFMVNALISGILFTAFYVRYRNILPLIIAHVLLDASSASGFDRVLVEIMMPIWRCL